MKNSWSKTLRRLAAGAMVAGATAFTSAMCYANAYDDALDPAYADGWQGQRHDDFGNQLNAGDNGGFGFTQWNFDSSYWWYGDPNRVFSYAGAPDGTGPSTAGIHAIDNGLGTGVVGSNPNNNIGPAWTLAGDATFKDVNRVGRGFDPLQIGQTFRIVIDNPTARPLGGGFTGYQLRLTGNTGGTNGNTCNGFGGNCTAHNPPQFPSPEMRFDIFQGPGGDPGDWHIVDAANVEPGLTDAVTAAAGVVLEVTRISATQYDAVMDPIGPGATYSATHTFATPADPIDWFEVTFYNYSGTATPAGYSDLATTPTDLYISRMEIVPEPGALVLLVLGVGTLAGCGRRRRHGA
jgi:hypothetical protein